MGHIAAEDHVDLAAHGEVGGVAVGGHDDHHVVTVGGDVQVHGGAHQLADIHLALNAVGAQHDVVGANAQNHVLLGHILGGQTGLLVIGQLHGDAVNGHGVPAVLLDQACVEEVHLRRADKARHEQVGRVVKHLLGRADLLDEAVLHDDDAVAQGHSLGLVVGHVDERGVDALAQLDDLGAHLITQLGVQIGQRFVHQKHGGVADDGAANGHTLALTAGQRLGLAVEILGDVQNLGGLPDLLVDLVLGHFLQLQGEGHVLIHGHVGVQRVVLEHHGDVPVLGLDVVHQLVADPQLAGGDVLQTGDHTQGGGLAAAGRANQHDELLVGDLQTELLDGHHALVGDLKIALLSGLFALLDLFLLLGVGVDLLEILEYDLCHDDMTVAALPPHGTASCGFAHVTAGLHTAAPPVRAGIPPFLLPERGIKWSAAPRWEWIKYT